MVGGMANLGGAWGWVAATPAPPVSSTTSFFRTLFGPEAGCIGTGHRSGQLPCRSAEVKFFSVFLCQRCREIWREILVKFSVLRFPGFGCATENFTKSSRQKRCAKRKISCKFHSAKAQRCHRCDHLLVVACDFTHMLIISDVSYRGAKGQSKKTAEKAPKKGEKAPKKGASGLHTKNLS